ncbi:MAG: hypothetical protein JO060_08305, partial [Candidatus Eremiobacteraeota bacterium]|nr:hypothetical protein [Candidatus Eremiobacteraeota bacterium]
MLLVIVDEQCQIRFSFCDGSAGSAVSRLLCDERGKLLPEVRVHVESFVAGPLRIAPLRPHVIQLDAHHSVRVSPLLGRDETLFALIVEAHDSDDAISRASKRFQLTRRQSEVLSLLLGGATAADVA